MPPLKTAVWLRKDLSPLEHLIMVPANHISRYKGLEFSDETRSKIFGKLRKHTIEAYIKAGSPSRSNLKLKEYYMRHKAAQP